MNQQMSDNFYRLNRFRDALTRATAVAETLGIVIDVHATLARMLEMHGDRTIRALIKPETGLTVSAGSAHFIITSESGASPTISLVHSQPITQKDQ